MLSVRAAAYPRELQSQKWLVPVARLIEIHLMVQQHMPCDLFLALVSVCIILLLAGVNFRIVPDGTGSPLSATAPCL